MKKINIAVIGLNFGINFAEIYIRHPNVGSLAVVDIDKKRIDGFLENNKDAEVYSSFEEVLADPSIDAVHICTPIPGHARQSAAVLNSGKHCACAVPMAVSFEEIKTVVEAVRKSGKNYMLMETQLFGAPYLTAREMQSNGEFGKIQHMRGVHYQPMENWPSYWKGLPPMHYSTHALAPLADIAQSRIKKVVCFGSGTMDKSLTEQYGNPFPFEDALFEFENGLKAEVVRGLFECAALTTESFNIYGSKKAFYTEYKNAISTKYNDPSQYDGITIAEESVKWKNRYYLLPDEIQRFTIHKDFSCRSDWRELLDTAPFSGHEGSHPFMVHEFISSIIEGRKSSVDEIFSANITAAGLCAHISAMNGGEAVDIPEY